MKTLIVEDTLINQEFLKMIMEQWGDCTVAESGEEALELVKSGLKSDESFDLIFMDIMLPGIDGLQTMERIRAMEKDTQSSTAQIIVTTALDDDGNASRAFMHGQAVSYITKPVREERIKEELLSLGLIED